MLNHDVNNPNAFGKGTPMSANVPACDLQMPGGENYAPNNFYSPLTNENYTWHYNSNNVHFISRINGDGLCEIVYEGNCLSLSPDPKHEIKQWRAILDVDFLCNKVIGGKLKRLVWTDGTATPIGSLDVEASIATNFFTTPFFDVCSDPCAYLQLCVPEPKGCLSGELIPFTDADKDLTNKILDKALKFAYLHVYYDGRRSELSSFSSLYFQDAKGCFDNSEGFARCIKFRLPIGNPMVEKIEFYFSEDGGLTWFLYETVEKYKKYNSAQQYWYERELSEDVNSSFSDSDCSFDYIFCNDKQRIPIDPKLLTRVTNPIPREVQGLFRIKDSIAAYNYVVGNCPIDRTEIDKFQIDLNCPEPSTDCVPEMAKVTVRAIIYNSVEQLGGYVYRSGGTVGSADDLTDLAHFGMGIKQYEQVFTGDVRNFMPYIEATNYQGVMKQWTAFPNFTSTAESGILSGVLSQDEIDRLHNLIDNGRFFYQEYVFNVPKGMKGIVRLASHYQTNAIGANQNTSTQVVGMLSSVLGFEPLHSYSGNTVLSGYNEQVKEMPFDTCAGDFDNFDAFIIADLIYTTEQAFSGYITDFNKQPVAGALIYANAEYKSTTDFNGFYFFADSDATQDISIVVEESCGAFSAIENFGAIGWENQMSRTNHEISIEGYANDFYANVNISVKDCNNLPVRGIRVALSGDKYKVTDVDGVAHFKVRNYSTRNRQIVATVMDKGNCFSYDCSDNCNPCMPSSEPTLLGLCFINTPDYNITLATLMNTQNLIANKRGLKDGGRYPFGVIAKGSCGRISAVNEIRYIDIPKIQESGGISFCSLDYDANNIALPDWVEELLIVRGVNLNPFYLQWVVDEIEYTTDGKIKLTIQSLNDYNKRFNFKTNTVYKYLAGDRVEFKKNGDGIIFDSQIHGILNYNILSPFNDEVISGVTDDVDYFNQIIIVDDGKLEGLTEGAIIEIQPATTSTPTLTYFGICASISVTDGLVDIQTGTFETFDTYLVNRQIGEYSAQLFAHNFPSDFWGSSVGGLNYITDIGRAYFVNQYENEKRYPRNISVNSATQMNYFGDFVKTLDAEEQGGIVALSVKDDKIGLALCENDNFLFQISDDFLRLGNDGIVRAAPVDSIISNPEAKIRGEYGVSYDDIGGIYFGDGFAFYPSSRSNSAILHNYSLAQMCGLLLDQQSGLTQTTCNSFFKKRMREKAKFNKNATNFLDHYRWSVGQNKINNVIYLTLKSLRQSGINNSQALYTLPNETIMYTPISDVFLGTASFTPESYSEISLATDEGCAFLSFINSLPYIHMINPDKWNFFYESAVDECVGIVINAGNKIVVPLAVEIQSDAKWFVSSVKTDKATFLSEIPAIKVVRNNGKWNAPLLNDINSIGGLYNGSNARGYFTEILFVKDNTIANQYGTIDNEKRTSYNELDSILCKVMVSEQSGMIVNL